MSLAVRPSNIDAAFRLNMKTKEPLDTLGYHTLPSSTRRTQEARKSNFSQGKLKSPAPKRDRGIADLFFKSPRNDAV